MRDSSLRVLNFHGVGSPGRTLDSGETEYWLETGQFVDILDAVAHRADTTITFDDGNASDVGVALAALVERDLKAAFFVLAGRMNEPGSLSDADIRTLLEAGMEVGSHGMYHRGWFRLDEAALHEEIYSARDRLEQATGRKVTTAACPFGLYDRRALRALRHAGYRTVFTSDGGAANPRAWLQARNTITRSQHAADVVALLDAKPRPDATLLRAAKTAVKRWR